MRNLTGSLYQLLYNHRKLLGGLAIVGAAILTIDYCSRKPITPIVHSPHIYNKKGQEMNIKKPFMPGEYSAVPGKGEHIYKITIDVKGDSKLPTEKTLTFIVGNDQKIELDTTGYSKKGKRVASEKTILYGKKAENKKPEIKKPEVKKTIKKEEPKEEPKTITPHPQKIEESKPLEQKVIEESKPKPFDLRQINATVYKIKLPSKDGWFLDFGSTLAHSKDGIEGVVEFMYPVGKEKDGRIEKSCFIAADVLKRALWDYQKPEDKLRTKSGVNKFVKALLDNGYIILGQNEDGLFLFDKESIKKYDIQVTLDQYKGLLPRRLCDVVTWKEDSVKLTGSGGNSRGSSRGSSEGGSGRGGHK